MMTGTPKKGPHQWLQGAGCAGALGCIRAKPARLTLISQRSRCRIALCSLRAASCVYRLVSISLLGENHNLACSRKTRALQKTPRNAAGKDGDRHKQAATESTFKSRQ